MRSDNTQMIQEIYQKSIKFAAERHKDQKIKGTNSSYIVHLSNVAMEVIVAYYSEPNFDIEYAVQLALLHDVLEDTDTSINEIKASFGEEVAIGVLALTKNEALPKVEQIYDSLIRINKLRKEVAIVKLCDRLSNLQKPPAFWTKDKIANYLQDAKMISRMLANKHKYLNNRLENKIADYIRYTISN